jgi:hypothetical protein
MCSDLLGCGIHMRSTVVPFVILLLHAGVHDLARYWGLQVFFERTIRFT